MGEHSQETGTISSKVIIRFYELITLPRVLSFYPCSLIATRQCMYPIYFIILQYNHAQGSRIHIQDTVDNISIHVL